MVKIPWKKVVTILTVLGAGVAAAIGEVGNQKRESTLKELTERVSKLENKD